MKIQLVFAVFLLATPAFAQAPDVTKKSDPDTGNSVQCWDSQTLVVRDRNTAPAAAKNDASGVAGQQQKATSRTAPSSSTPGKIPTAEEAANAKRPPGIADC